MKKKTLEREPYSIEDTLTDLITKLGYEEISKVINKQKSSIQNISNPTYKERLLSHQDALDLDIYCKKKGLGTPFLKSYITLIERYTSNIENGNIGEVRNHLLKIGESIGDLMEETRKALNDEMIDETEKDKIAKEVKKLEAKISDLKIILKIGDKTDYSKVAPRK